MDKVARIVTDAFAEERSAESFPDLVRIIKGSDGGTGGVSAWQDLDFATLTAGPEGDLGALLNFMPAEMWRAFVPAWMIAVLDHGAASPDTLSALMVSIDPEMSAQVLSAEFFPERLASLTEGQRLAILAFSKAIRGRQDIMSFAREDIGARLADTWASHVGRDVPLGSR